MKICLLVPLACAMAFPAHWARAQTASEPGATASPASVLEPLPIRDVAIFKDGHAFVLHQGEVRSDARGQVALGGLPAPVLGTFWPFVTGARLQSATATRQGVTSLRDVQSVREMLKANVGADIIVLEGADKRYDATILSITKPELSADTPNSPRTDSYGRPLRDEVVLLKTADGVRVMPLSALQSVIFKSPPRVQAPAEETRALLRLQLDAANRTAQAGAAYLQRGLRWIPAYRLQLSGSERAALRLQATVVNDLADLRGVAARLVIGAPSFALRDSIDPISLQAALERVAEGRGGYGGFSNAIQSQAVSSSYVMGAPPVGGPTPERGPSVEGGTANEDFFLFNVANLSLKKGERSVFEVARSEVRYRDVFVAQSPLAPPPEVYQSLSYEQQRQASLLSRAAFVHKLRVTNTGREPLTTAPILIERNGQLLAQGLVTYTAPGGQSDIDLAPAVDITLKRSEDEVKRAPNALEYRGNKYARVDVAGKLTVTSFRSEPVTVEITRQFLGKVEKAGEGAARGTIRQVAAGDDEATLDGRLPAWWSSTDYYRRALNPLSEVTWTLTLPAKGTVELPYEYFYFWG